MNATEELPRGQQILLQRLIANHCVSDKEARRTFELLLLNGKDYTEDNDDVSEDGEGPSKGTRHRKGNETIIGVGIETLEDAFVSINRQLKPGFALEIITMVDISGNSAKYYHAVVNTAADEIAKSEAVFSKSWNPHERAFIRLLMKTLVKQNNDDEKDDGNRDEGDDEDSEDKSKKKKVPVLGIRRADLINLRSDLEGGFKLNLEQATRVITILLEEKWLRVSSSTEKNRRESMQGVVELAPRSYMELYHYITALGLPEDKLPQFLYHRD